MKKLDILICESFSSRLRGLMMKKSIDRILCFPKCNSIHTMFMLINIDVYMTDKNNKILYIYKNLKPWKIILPKTNVYYTYETPLNYYDYKLNDYIK